MSETAARYLDILAAVEQAHVCNRPDELRSLLDGVDPLEVKALAAELRDREEQLELQERRAA